MESPPVRGDGAAELLGARASIGEAGTGGHHRALSPVFLEEMRHDLDQDRRPQEARGDQVHQGGHLILGQVHGQSLDDHQDIAGRPHLFGPVRVEGGGGDHMPALALPQQLPAQVDDVGEVEVVPGEAAVIEAMETRIQAAGDVDHGGLGVGQDESGDQGVEREGAHDHAAGHEAIARRLREVVVESGDEIDGGPVLEARAGGQGVLGPGVQREQHRLADAGQVHPLTGAHGSTRSALHAPRAPSALCTRRISRSRRSHDQHHAPPAAEISRAVSITRGIEIGRNPRRDRPHSGSKSVQFRIEIGRNPHRDRSGRSSHAGSRDRRCGYHGTRTYLCDVNGGSSHPSGGRAQKDGRKLSTCGKPSSTPGPSGSHPSDSPTRTRMPGRGRA